MVLLQGLGGGKFFVSILKEYFCLDESDSSLQVLDKLLLLLEDVLELSESRLHLLK